MGVGKMLVSASVGLLLSTVALAEIGAADPTCPNSYEAGDAFDGVWQGVAEKDGRKWPVEISVDEIRPGDRTVRISLPDWVVHHQPLKVTGASRKTLCLTWHIWDSKLVLHGDGKAATGKWSASKDRNSTLSLKRIKRAPFRPHETEVTFDGFNGAKLAGTLILPPGRGPFPVIVWTHGSGPDTRNTVHYASRAYLAVQEGAGALIYDKRGAGRSTGEAAYDLRNVIGDARAAVEFVSKLEPVASDRVLIAGYSQGGWIAPAVASEFAVSGIIVGSAPGITPAEQNIWNFRQEAVGILPEAAIEKAAQTLRDTYEYYRTGEGYETIVATLADPENSAWAEHSFYRRLLLIGDGELPKDPEPDDYASLFIDPLPWWRKISVPVLGVWGARDKAVPPRLSRKLIAGALAEAGNGKASLKVFESAGHGLMVEAGSGAEWDWPRAADGYPRRLRSWIRQHAVIPTETSPAGHK